MRLALYKHGTPPTIEALADLLKDELINNAYRVYIAETGWEIVTCMTRGKYQKKHWSDIIRPDNTTPEKTGDEIFATICAKALNRGDNHGA